MENPPKRKYKKHKEGYTISVSHILRKDRNFLEKLLSKEDRDGTPYLPIYIRVNFLQQTAMLKSRLDKKLREEDFESYITRPEVAQFVECEAKAIRYSIEEFEPDKKEEFVMSQWTSHYNSWNEPIKEVVQEQVGSLLLNDLKVKYALDKTIPAIIEAYLRTILHTFEGIQTMASLGLYGAQEYIERYRLLFQMDHFQESFDQVAPFTVWDWRSENYQNLLRKAHGQLVDPYLDVIKDVLADYKPNEH